MIVFFGFPQFSNENVIILRIRQLTINPVEQRTSWEANRFSASQQGSRTLWNLKIHYPIHNSPSPVPVLSHQFSPYHQPTSVRSILIFPSTLGSSSWSLSFRFPHQNPVCTSSPPYVQHALPISIFFILSPELCLVNSTEHKVPRYVVFFTTLLPRSS
jgi:hypothetical protein